MTRTVPLHDIAHARAGDKGDRSNVSLFAYDPKDFPAIKAQIDRFLHWQEQGSIVIAAMQYNLTPLLNIEQMHRAVLTILDQVGLSEAPPPVIDTVTAAE